MRVFISIDMEGVAGVVDEDQTDPKDPLVGRFVADDCPESFRVFRTFSNLSSIRD